MKINYEGFTWRGIQKVTFQEPRRGNIFKLILEAIVCWNLLLVDSFLNIIDPSKNIISLSIQNRNKKPNPKYYLQKYV